MSDSTEDWCVVGGKSKTKTNQKDKAQNANKHTNHKQAPKKGERRSVISPIPAPTTVTTARLVVKTDSLPKSSQTVFKWNATAVLTEDSCANQQMSVSVPNNIDEHFISTCESFLGCSNIRCDENSGSNTKWSPIGLINSGDSCFKNCILQCLFCLPIFHELLSCLLLRFADDMRHHLSAKFVFWRELLDFSKCAFSNQAHHGKVSILPDSYFCNSFEAFNNYVTGNAGSNGTSMNEGSQRSRSQHDCMEFLTFLLDKLHEEVKQDLKRDNVVDCAQQDDGWSTIGKGGSKLIVDEQSRTVAETTAASSVIANMFQGLLRCEVEYKQKKLQSTTFQSFHCLTLNFAQQIRRRQQLTEALNDFFSPEMIESQKVRKQVKLEYLPHVLVIHIGRFSFDFKSNTALKIHREMEYHHKLVLSPRYISDTLRSEGLKNSYELQGVVLHHGENSTEGHYSSYVKDESGHWWHANDTDISWMSEDDVLMAEDKVYLLFYHRTSN